MFLNFLSNALKFSRQREQASIEIGGKPSSEELVCFVRDNGASFDMRCAGKIFGVFRRLHHTDEYEGTGVGLSIVQRITQRHGGRVWADAKVNGGTIF